jgi:hypothetical protein
MVRSRAAQHQTITSVNDGLAAWIDPTVDTAIRAASSLG